MHLPPGKTTVGIWSLKLEEMYFSGHWIFRVIFANGPVWQRTNTQLHFSLLEGGHSVCGEMNIPHGMDTPTILDAHT